MKSTALADLFYKLGINPFYVMALLVFVVPIGFLFLFAVVLSYKILFAVLFTVLMFLGCSALFYSYFHRNPHREITVDSNAILSPADGMVVYVKKFKNGEILESVKRKNHMKLAELMDVTDKRVHGNDASGFIIGIELRLFDVHVTRSPVTGKKILDHHVSGRIVSMNNPLFEYINDRETVVLKQESSKKDGSSLMIAVVQIATVITRTVKSYVREKIQIKQGEPLGIIRLGSQVDVVIFSSDVKILVKERDRVYAGITKLAENTSL